RLAPGKRSRGGTEGFLQAKQQRRVGSFIVEHLHQECGRTPISALPQTWCFLAKRSLIFTPLVEPSSPAWDERHVQGLTLHEVCGRAPISSVVRARISASRTVYPLRNSGTVSGGNRGSSANLVLSGQTITDLHSPR